MSGRNGNDETRPPVRVELCMRHTWHMKPQLSFNHRLHMIDDIENELPMLAVAATFIVCTALAVYLYAAAQ